MKTNLTMGALFSLALCWSADAMAQGISRVQGEACPPGSTHVSVDEANAQRDAICRQLGQWDIARLANGGSMDGPGYACKTRPSDTRQLGHSLCKPSPATEPQPPPPPPAEAPGAVYDGAHPHWRDTVTLNADGTYRRGNGDPGTWTFDGRTLVLRWKNWGPETLEVIGFRSSNGQFTLTPRGPAVVAPAQAMAGVYDGAHPHWRDAVILNADGTYRRGNGDPGTWTFDGKTLVLRWKNWGPETLVVVGPGRLRAPTNGFTLTKRR